MLNIFMSTISWFPLVAITVLYAKVGLLTIRPHKVLHQLLVLFPLIVALAQITHPVLRNVIALIPVMLLAIDIMLSIFSWQEYRSRFSYGFALSILDTNKNEINGMIGVYRRYVPVFCFLAILLFTSVNVNYSMPDHLRYLPLLFMSLVLLVYTVQALVHRLRKNRISSPLQRIISDLPISNMNPFLQAIRDKRIISKVSRQAPTYSLTVQDTGIDTYVVVIGESARPANMSLYGYSRPTTPCAEIERENMLLFTQAISGSPVTANAVPLAMSAATLIDHDIRHYADNIINVANNAGFETHWYSAQGMYGDYSNAITGIAMNAHQHEWVKECHDDALLPLLDNALSSPGKKLIVLHIYGSHPPSNQRYPESENYFQSDNEMIDGYDNSIRFTDKLLGEIFSRLKNNRSSLLYFSDHGLERVHGKKNALQHGGVKPLPEAFHVPMFIWHGSNIESQPFTNGTVEKAYSTVNNYMLMTHWLGVSLNNASANSTPIQFIELLDAKISVMDTTGDIYLWPG
ncbi:phosphoethanolamine transferase [Enterobacter hormaechei]|uniref:phosphoethanolamine transferase n=1 Tax=Enterobacter hormaechei TaxID=158836 RepID=UPI002414618F|nr:phosphoethanolamine transferase [Enterobacter hormaechei]MDG4714148.1 phosphoethanolamine transferase [Enterobacter hormaechei]MDG4726534.1 phosphoethanolamine transferase [Enterobacter hormaechei]